MVPGRAHIEVRTATRPGSESLARQLEAALNRLEGVHWVEVNAIIGRVAVAFDGDAANVEDVLGVVESVEEATGVAGEPFSFDRPDHPGDPEPVRRAVAGLVADVAGIGMGVFGSVLRSTPIPVELAGIISLLDSEPRARRVVENMLGPATADLALSTLNAAAQGLAQGPIALTIDGLLRTLQLRDAQARQRLWVSIDSRLPPQLDDDNKQPVRRSSRPKPLPPGPVETYADRAAMASILGAGVTMAATGQLRRATGVLLAGTPKAARLGREAFASQLGWAMAQRGIVVSDPRALRRLDRIDTVCIDAGSLLTGRSEVSHLELVGSADQVEIHQRVRTLFDPAVPDRARRRRGWTVGPLDALDVDRTLDVRRARRRLNGKERVLALAEGSQVRAVFTVRDELAPGTSVLVDLAHQGDLMVVVAGDDLSLVERIGADLLVDAGDSLVRSVRMMQDDDCTVALFAPGPTEALTAADLGVALTDGDRLSWGGHLMVRGGLRDVAFVVEAAGVAHEVSRQSAALALGGSATGSVLSVAGEGHSPGRAMTAVNVAAFAALANGTRAALGLHRRAHPDFRKQPAWHELEVDEVLTLLGTDRDGLSEAAARDRRVATRVLSAPFRFGQAVTAELMNPLTPVLAGGAVLSASVGSAIDAAVIGSVTGFNAVLGATQRFRAERAVDALSHRNDPTAVVVHDGHHSRLPADQLVPGNVILLEAGSVVPADARIIEADNLEVDEATLTGESLPVDKGPEPCMAVAVADRTSMLYEGTTITAGNARAVVVAVGDETQASAGMPETGDRPTVAGVEARLSQLSARTLPFAGLGGAAVVASGMLRGRPLSHMLGAGVSLAVAAVPEGLPMLATMAQLSAARRLSERGALVRNARAVEALGRVDVLCTDKTGTLTEGRIRLHTVSDGSRPVRAGALGAAQRAVLSAGLRATPAAKPGGRLPHPTDQAVVDAAAEAGADTALGATGWARMEDVPFEPSRSYHAGFGATPDGVRVSVKGAPEAVLGRCVSRRTAKRTQPMSAQARRTLTAHVDRLAHQGLRVLAVAERTLAAGEAPGEDAVTGLELVGFLALSDPVRATAAEAVKSLRRAGVDVVMVTGDHPSTAEGIAVELGVLGDRRVMTGAELDAIDDDALAAVLPEVSVFARVTPADKVRIVAALQRAGHAVAMTGDGANDAPAIRLADAGLALGRHATPAARNAADVVITDDRIETIVHAIIEGRAMWGSVRDALSILLGGNLGEIGFTVGASALTGRTPLSSRQLLLVNLLTDVAPALSIAVRPPRSRSYNDLLAEGPDRSLGASLDRAIAMRAITTMAGASSAWGIATFTGGRRRANTVGLVALVGTQLGQTLTMGATHPTTIAASLGSAAVLAGIVQTPGVSQFFGCTPLDPLAWATAVGSASAATVGGWAVPRLVEAITTRSAAGADVDLSRPADVHSVTTDDAGRSRSLRSTAR